MVIEREAILKRQLNYLIEQYGTLDNRTVKKSQELDKVIVKKQKALMAITCVV